MTHPPFFIGLMSGTSADSIDACVVDFSDNTPRLVATQNEAIDADTKAAIHALTISGTSELMRMGQLDQVMATAFAKAALKVIEKAGISREDVRAIGSHGQTIRHQPEGEYPFTLQIGDPNKIAELTGITTVADFRRRDMAAGGQGAPLAPGFHRAMFGQTGTNTAVLNVGGIANISLLGSDGSVIGFDTGPGNTLMDGWVQNHQQRPFDADGSWAMSGAVDEALLSSMLSDPFFTAAPPKSTGPDYFCRDWLEAQLKDRPGTPAAEDVQRTLLELTACSVALSLNDRNLAGTRPKRLAVCGGGVHNSALMARFTELLPETEVITTASLGIDPDWVEAFCFAWLAARTLDDLPGNEPAVTGASGYRVLGGIYRG